MTGRKENMLYLLVIPFSVVVIAHLLSRGIYTSPQAVKVATIGWIVACSSMALFTLWSYSPTTLVFYTIMGLAPMLLISGIAIIEGADKVERRERRLAQQRRAEMFDPFTR